MTPGEARRLDGSSIVALGDSITADGGYAKELSEQLDILPQFTGESKTLVFGYPGKGAKYIKGQLGKALWSKPKYIIVLAGVNDVAAGRSVKKITRQLKEIYVAAQRQKVKVIAVEITPWAAYKTSTPEKQSNTRAVNSWIRLQKPFLHKIVRTGTLGDADGKLIDTRDGLHLNKKGQKKLGRMIFSQAFAGGSERPIQVYDMPEMVITGKAKRKKKIEPPVVEKEYTQKEVDRRIVWAFAGTGLLIFALLLLQEDN